MATPRWWPDSDPIEKNVMATVRIKALVATCLLTAATVAGCGGGTDPALQRAAEHCVAEAQNAPAGIRSAYEAGCAKAQANCADKTRRNEKLCEAWLTRYE